MNTATIDMPCWWTISMNVCLLCTFANIVNVLNVVKQCQLELHRQKSVALTKTKTHPTERWKGVDSCLFTLEVSELCSERKIVYLSDRRIDARSQVWWIWYSAQRWHEFFQSSSGESNSDWRNVNGDLRPRWRTRATYDPTMSLHNSKPDSVEAAWWNFEWYYNIMLDRSSWHIDGT